MNIEQELKQILPETRIKTRYIDVISFASDAGFYHLVPAAVVQPVGEAEIIALFRFSQQHRIPLVFRTGGTSLSGQSITDGILVDLSQFWNKIQVEDAGNRVRVQPGITGAMVNAHLKRHSRKIGPDPSSISAAMMGGILSNNSSGMCCGVVQNSYHTTRYIRFILPDGRAFSTENPADYQRFKDQCPELFLQLATFREQITSDEKLQQRIRYKYQTKNTVGYSLNAFIDYAHPLDILAHLLIGAEGTLAFIAEAVLDTVPDYAFKSTALLYFPTIYDACQAIVPLTRAGALMVELMDRASLRAVENMDGIPAIVKTLPPTAAALLVEFQENSQQELDTRVQNFLASTGRLSLSETPVFTTDPAAQAFFWKIRKGLFPAVGAVRASGTTVILEDIAFPVEKLGDAISDIQQLFLQYNYLNAIIFGHAKDGNIHFVVTQSFNTPDEVTRYDRFLRDVVTLVVDKYDGTLKAEHGTGRNMAPFVETEWGGDAYEIMKKIKAAADPHGLLNPGVIINSDAEVHLKNLKELPAVEEEVDRCIECGYCEHKCPSRDITATPRRRIVIRRALKKLENDGDKKHYQLLLDQYQYDGLETCAVDGLCATACPVDINTGDLVKRLRRENHSASANKMALRAARHFKTVEATARMAIKTGAAINSIFGEKAMINITAALRRLIPAIPLWSAEMTPPPHLSILKSTAAPASGQQDTIVYFPACISRMMGSYKGKSKNLLETFMSICRKSAISVIVPEQLSGSCCSQIFSSKGFKDAYAWTANSTIEKMWAASRNGALPVVTDVSSCAYTLHHVRPVLTAANQQKFDQLRILDSVDFLHEYILPRATASQKKKNIVLHPVCSLEKMKTTHKFIAIANHFAEEVTVPKNAGCCGMAGDRGFLFPELTASATRPEATELAHHSADGYYSSTKTCEIAMSTAVKHNYESVLYLVDETL
ncbi:FAD-binding and (Fe-S)-binding domain-containing protein [Chitinophaga solisilvae]|uniref:D-lactate dehydrogenase (cytochrome) n=1 Tax=Chitinophaga solisilvae TaxID=1233460 RepID=A0A3S1B3A9_9BACT|nr:FAD-binding and (Fe-S)-binding domain-containing protein [Chitinophaga solisilvae]NSL90817.1 FAD-binding oxidoreductase [Chitinophaga solisilvae]